MKSRDKQQHEKKERTVSHGCRVDVHGRAKTRAMTAVELDCIVYTLYFGHVTIKCNIKRIPLQMRELEISYHAGHS